ncbi:unnamed protein product [Closterium sp. NIES-65]|nr:unnamed protein product [Closterium sp. NIES-65]
MAELETQVGAERARVGAAEGEMRALNAQLAELEAQLGAQRAKADEAERAMGELDSKLGLQRERGGEAEGEVKELEAKLGQQRERAEAAERELEEVRSELGQVGQLREQVEEAEREVRELEGKLERQKVRAEEAEGAARRVAEEMGAELAGMRERMVEYVMGRKTAEHREREASARGEEERGRREEAEKRVRELEEEVRRGKEAEERVRELEASVARGAVGRGSVGGTVGEASVGEGKEGEGKQDAEEKGEEVVVRGEAGESELEDLRAKCAQALRQLDDTAEVQSSLPGAAARADVLHVTPSLSVPPSPHSAGAVNGGGAGGAGGVAGATGRPPWAHRGVAGLSSHPLPLFPHHIPTRPPVLCRQLEDAAEAQGNLEQELDNLYLELQHEQELSTEVALVAEEEWRGRQEALRALAEAHRQLEALGALGSDAAAAAAAAAASAGASAAGGAGGEYEGPVMAERQDSFARRRAGEAPLLPPRPKLPASADSPGGDTSAAAADKSGRFLQPQQQQQQQQGESRVEGRASGGLGLERTSSDMLSYVHGASELLKGLARPDEGVSMGIKLLALKKGLSYSRAVSESLRTDAGVGAGGSGEAGSVTPPGWSSEAGGAGAGLAGAALTGAGQAGAGPATHASAKAGRISRSASRRLSVSLLSPRSAVQQRWEQLSASLIAEREAHSASGPARWGPWLHGRGPWWPSVSPGVPGGSPGVFPGAPGVSPGGLVAGAAVGRGEAGDVVAGGAGAAAGGQSGRHRSAFVHVMLQLSLHRKPDPPAADAGAAADADKQDDSKQGDSKQGDSKEGAGAKDLTSTAGAAGAAGARAGEVKKPFLHIFVGESGAKDEGTGADASAAKAGDKAAETAGAEGKTQEQTEKEQQAAREAAEEAAEEAEEEVENVNEMSEERREKEVEALMLQAEALRGTVALCMKESAAVRQMLREAEREAERYAEREREELRGGGAGAEGGDGEVGLVAVVIAEVDEEGMGVREGGRGGRERGVGVGGEEGEEALVVAMQDGMASPMVRDGRPGGRRAVDKRVEAQRAAVEAKEAELAHVMQQLRTVDSRIEQLLSAEPPSPPRAAAAQSGGLFAATGSLFSSMMPRASTVSLPQASKAPVVAKPSPQPLQFAQLLSLSLTPTATVQSVKSSSSTTTTSATTTGSNTIALQPTQAAALPAPHPVDLPPQHLPPQHAPAQQQPLVVELQPLSVPHQQQHLQAQDLIPYGQPVGQPGQVPVQQETFSRQDEPAYGQDAGYRSGHRLGHGSSGGGSPRSGSGGLDPGSPYSDDYPPSLQAVDLRSPGGPMDMSPDSMGGYEGQGGFGFGGFGLMTDIP